MRSVDKKDRGVLHWQQKVPHFFSTVMAWKRNVIWQMEQLKIMIPVWRKQKSVPRLAWHYHISSTAPPIMKQQDTVKRFYPAYMTEIILGQRWHTVHTNLYIPDMSVTFMNLGIRSYCHELAKIVERMSHRKQPVQAPHICCTSCLGQPHEASLGSRVCTVARNKQ